MNAKVHNPDHSYITRTKRFFHMNDFSMRPNMYLNQNIPIVKGCTSLVERSIKTFLLCLLVNWFWQVLGLRVLSASPINTSLYFSSAMNCFRTNSAYPWRISLWILWLLYLPHASSLLSIKGPCFAIWSKMAQKCSLLSESLDSSCVQYFEVAPQELFFI